MLRALWRGVILGGATPEGARRLKRDTPERRYAIVLVGVLLAAPASADCGWVLWERQTTYAESGAVTGGHGWWPTDGFSGASQCSAGVERQVDRDKSFGALHHERSTTQFYRATADQTLRKIVNERMCLPGTVDPRR
jgi:hypothetical protein